MKIFDKKMIIWLVGLITLVFEFVIVTINLTRLNILTYLLYIGFFPAFILFVTSLVYSFQANTSKLSKYILSVIVAVIFSAILLVYFGVYINEEIVERIIQNSMTFDTMQVSINTATVGDNIQMFLLYIAFSGIGCFIGNLVYKKRRKSINSHNNNDTSEYDS